MYKSPNNTPATFSPLGNGTFSITTPTCQREATEMGESGIVARQQNVCAGQGGLWEAVTWGSPWPLALMTQFCSDLCGLGAALAATPEELCGKLVSRGRGVALPSVWSPGCAHKLINRGRPCWAPAGAELGAALQPRGPRAGEELPATTVSVWFPSLHALGLEIAAQGRLCENIPGAGLFFLLYLLFFSFFLNIWLNGSSKRALLNLGFCCQGFVPTELQLTYGVKKNNF